MFYGASQPQLTPQQLAAGLQRQQMMQQVPQGQMPMSMQRQPQGGMAGRTVPLQPMSRF